MLFVTTRRQWINCAPGLSELSSYPKIIKRILAGRPSSEGVAGCIPVRLCAALLSLSSVRSVQNQLRAAGLERQLR